MPTSRRGCRPILVCKACGQELPGPPLHIIKEVLERLKKEMGFGEKC